jgi:threonine synthase
MGILIWLEVAERLGLGGFDRGSSPPLAIASCGNAALAAAVLARAGGRRLEVFVPPDANPTVLGLLRQMEAVVSPCRRDAVGEGDPCMLRFREAVVNGALPFACQGSENGLTLEGGKTLAYEMVAEMMAQGLTFDRLFVQVGGGALASASIQGLREALELRLIEKMPMIHAVQTKGAHPLRLAYNGVVERIVERYRREARTTAAPPEGDDERAHFIATVVPKSMVQEELAYAATHRSQFMRPWPTPPSSVAGGILDDETYDWWAVVRGMLTTGGFPVVVSEERLGEAHAAARRQTTIAVDPTGSAGLAGALELSRAGLLKPDETVAVLFTGPER